MLQIKEQRLPRNMQSGRSDRKKNPRRLLSGRPSRKSGQIARLCSMRDGL